MFPVTNENTLRVRDVEQLAQSYPHRKGLEMGFEPR